MQKALHNAENPMKDRMKRQHWQKIRVGELQTDAAGFAQREISNGGSHELQHRQKIHCGEL